MLKKRLKHDFYNIRSDFKYSKYMKVNKKYCDTIAADIIRLTHSIEKGLTLKNVILGYGHEKQKQIMSLVPMIEHKKSKYYEDAIKMAVSALNEYLIYHKKKNYTDDFMNTIEAFVNKHEKYITENYGGAKTITKSEMKFDIKEIEKFFNTRHSIRDFDDKPVDKKTLLKAIKLAQTAPSACNRQGVRVHIVDKSKAQDLIKWLSGVGGFAQCLDKIIIITGKTSSYRYNENYQYIVSASIFAAYLSLTLHLYGLGACFVQRPVVWTKKWNEIKKANSISDDEQIICILGIGTLKEKCVVPISHRLDVETISNFIE